MDKNRIVTYSLLAHINNNSTGIKDFNDIFIPLVKRTLYKMCSNGITKGILLDVKTEMDKLYSLDMPFPLLKKNLHKIADEFNSAENKDFQVFKNDGSFILNKYLFLEYEEIINQQEADIEAATLTYEKYLEGNGYKISEQPSIFEFLDKHRLSLSNFFANKTDVSLGNLYLVQANFINEMRGVKGLFEILKRIYFGSIITSYLEVDFGTDNNNKLELILDTTFIISLLELHSIEATHTCRKILEICKRLGYKVYVLDDTIQEAQGLLNRTAENFSKNFLSQRVDVNGIYNACERLALNKTDLERYSGNLETKLSHYGIFVIANTEKYKRIAKFSNVYETLKKRKSNPDGALHDAIAITYVKEKRGKKVKSFYEAKCWFVTDMKSEFYENSDRKEIFLSESIRADELVNILWLSNPNVKIGDINEIGLTRLVANTINDSLPNPRVLKEFDDNIQKYAFGKIEASDCVRVANMIANKTLTNLEQLNKTANSNKEDFILQLKDLSARAKQDEAKKVKVKNEIIETIYKEFEERFSKRNNELKDKYELELIEAKYHISSAKENEINAKEISKNNEIMTERKKRLQLLYNQLSILNNSKAACEISASKYARNCIIILSIFLVLAYLFFGYFLYKSDWNLIQWKLYYIGILMSLGLFLLGAFFDKKIKFNPIKIRKNIKNRKTKKNINRLNIDVKEIAEIENEIESLNLLISTNVTLIKRKNEIINAL